MSESAVVQPEPVADGLTAGALLRRAREAAGLHVAALAVALKVPVRKLEALEEDRFDLLPDAVFVRALASSVCRTLKVDPQPVLERLPQTAVPRLVQDHDGINAPFRAPSDGAGPSWFDHVSKPVFVAVFALLLGALVLIFLPAVQRDDAAVATRPEVLSPPVPMIIPGPASEPPVAAQPAAVAVPVATRTAAAVVSPTDSTPRVISPTVVVTPSPAIAKAVSATATASPVPGLVVFHTRGPSWVEVTDARGVVALRRLLAAGDTAGASGALPLAVTIGSANTTEVQVRGKPFDLGAVSRDNVARFEVK
jgi:cytoskeleton protein RodZ